MKFKQSNHKRKLRMWQENPHCWYCERLTILHVEVTGVPLPQLAATVDHLWHRRDPRRTKAEEGPLVLACHQCNLRRGTMDAEAFRARVRVTLKRPWPDWLKELGRAYDGAIRLGVD